MNDVSKQHFKNSVSLYSICGNHVKHLFRCSQACANKCMNQNCMQAIHKWTEQNVRNRNSCTHIICFLMCFPTTAPCSTTALLLCLLSMASTLDSVRPHLRGAALSCYPHFFLPIALLVTPCSRRRQADLYFLLLPIPEVLRKEANSRFRGSGFSIQCAVY